MKVLVTGADGFIGKNLCVTLNRRKDLELIKFTRQSSIAILPSLVAQSDFIFHIAGVNRPTNESDFFEGNTDLTKIICDSIRAAGHTIPVIFTSSIQATCPNAYGRSKLQAEIHLLNLYFEFNNPVYIYRLPNVFGKWCKPNYNSAVATFCHNINHGLPVQIHDKSASLKLVHIDDVISSFLQVMCDSPKEALHIDVNPVYETTVGALIEQLYKFKDSRDNLVTEPVGDGFTRLLYATYVSYMPPSQFGYPLNKNEDSRGVFVEMLKTKDSGQFSFFTAHPGVTRGGHYHHVKTEKFLVIKGRARFRFRNIDTDEVCDIFTTGDTPEVIETVPGWSHDITNIGDEEMVVMLWANEIFDSENPDTFAYNV
ncbi:SDR family oxidoreductase [Aliidiomarina halalkaliphila]|uniref:SDR family oxidoreductase n=1 Tax=Aliidiomarina halalkaliphila TaxID=2593535 RepID=A0A552X5F4_9GAMM|nr:NAD-dependent epimerase/dehydratase family protein [Aliidiomarina halalkaliphila]TRW50189.1 SDR family oxidoreductase [Aliidiomarina halalkaliphila]